MPRSLGVFTTTRDVCEARRSRAVRPRSAAARTRNGELAGRRGGGESMLLQEAIASGAGARGPNRREPGGASTKQKRRTKRTRQKEMLRGKRNAAKLDSPPSHRRQSIVWTNAPPSRSRVPLLARGRADARIGAEGADQPLPTHGRARGAAVGHRPGLPAAGLPAAAGRLPGPAGVPGARVPAAGPGLRGRSRPLRQPAAGPALWLGVWRGRGAARPARWMRLLPGSGRGDAETCPPPPAPTRSAQTRALLPQRRAA